MRKWPYIVAFLAATAGRPAAGTPLAEDLAARRAIRGETVDPSRESDELRQLRRFDEESFPRRYLGIPGASEPPGAGRPIGEPEEGPSPAPPPALPSAEAPPPELRSPGGGAGPGGSGRGGGPDTAVPWLAGLKLPDLPVRFDPRVVRYLEFYKNDPRGRAIIRSWLRAQGRFRPLIEEALKRAGLPRGLLYVAMIESGFDPHDRSSVGAVGLWQFMPENSQIYGLRVDHWVDERQDPERATQQMMHYFADLKARFGSWHLALAAFNAGYGAVLRAIAKYNTNDYWELCRHEDGLPWETTLYVPKVLAVAIVDLNRAAFGVDDVVEDPPWDYDRVVVPASTSLQTIAKAAGVDAAKVVALNPELRRGRTPPTQAAEEPWVARVPRGSGPRFAASYEKLRERLAPHVVRFGEPLDEIAAAAGASTPELRRINGIRDASEVRAGMVLLVPEGRAPIVRPESDEPVLVAVPDKDAVVPGRQRVFYRVQPGDGLKDIASFFGVSVGDLARWNHLDLDARLSSKQVLQLWAAPGFDVARAALVDPARVYLVTMGSPEFFDLVEARRGRKRLVHKVRHGETLERIAARYHLTAADLERINRFGRKSALVPGQDLIVYVPMSTAEKAEADRRWRVALAGGATGDKAGNVEKADKAEATSLPAAPAADKAEDDEEAEGEAAAEGTAGGAAGDEPVTAAPAVAPEKVEKAEDPAPAEAVRGAHAGPAADGVGVKGEAAGAGTAVETTEAGAAGPASPETQGR
jgi:membrane-bound lytic murein transglycosylase D